VLELGPGPGTATRHLLELGASPLVAIEPNPALASYLAERESHVQIIVSTFEEAELPSSSFDLVVAATSFHWIDPTIGLPKVSAVLRPGGWWAVWSSIHGDQTENDRFHQATADLLGPSPAVPWSRFTDERANVSAFRRAGFANVEYELIQSTARYDPAGIRSLYASFSGILRRPEEERTKLLAALEQIARDEFGGVVERAILTPLYTAQRP